MCLSLSLCLSPSLSLSLSVAPPPPPPSLILHHLHLHRQHAYCAISVLSNKPQAPAADSYTSPCYLPHQYNSPPPPPPPTSLLIAPLLSSPPHFLNPWSPHPLPHTLPPPTTTTTTISLSHLPSASFALMTGKCHMGINL